MPTLFPLDPEFPSPPPAAPPRDIAGYAQVSPERGMDVPEGLTYAVPKNMADLPVGARVVAPFRNQKVAGWVLSRSETCAMDPRKVKALLDWDKECPVLPADLVLLAQWMARYYASPLGMVFAAMLPSAVKADTGRKEVAQVRRSGKAAEGKLTALQKKLLEVAEKVADGDVGGPFPWFLPSDLCAAAGAKTAGPVAKLLELGLLEEQKVTQVKSRLAVQAAQVGETPNIVALSPGQAAALSRLERGLGEGFGACLLHGVTGSGKTEVYLRLIEKLVRTESAAPGVIVLVPEIALTPQTVGRFYARFPAAKVAVLHSGLSAAQRHAEWRRIESGEATIVVGARSAIFAPLANLRLIVVDEEHEPSYKQDQAPRYHARDVAVCRAFNAKCQVVLGSATPSLESFLNAKGFGWEGDARERGSPDLQPVGSSAEGAGLVTRVPGLSAPAVRPPRPHWHYLHLPDRVPGAQMPKVKVVDMVAERRLRKGIHLMSCTLEDELQKTLAAGHQAVLLLNRRGFANWVACPDHHCGWQMRCDHCDAGMIYHRDARLPLGGMVKCHHCAAEQRLPPTCPCCGKRTTTFGLGTQRVEDEIARKFPSARLLRMDADTMKKAEDYRIALDAFREGSADILLGTQMVAKGLDFPRVTLVGVVSADTALALPDFRAAERTFQLISQVAGRAGRGSEPGRVVVQTFQPDAAPIVAAVEHDYLGFAQEELGIRVEAQLPPAVRMVRLLLRGEKEDKTRARAEALAEAALSFVEAKGLPVRLTPAAPCSVARVADHYRFEFQMTAADPAQLQRVLAHLRQDAHGGAVAGAELAVDVDPVALM